MHPERVWRAIQDAAAGTLPDLWREPPAVFDDPSSPADEAPDEASRSRRTDLDEIRGVRGRHICGRLATLGT